MHAGCDIGVSAVRDLLSPVPEPLPKTIVIVGPTAGGKTELAIELASKLPGGGECICADSMQIYKGMDIGTAKPMPDERARAPHHLLDMIDPSDDGFTVDQWLKLATQTIHEVGGRGHVPIIVGGTNLYIQALLRGMFNGPEPDPALRAKLEATTQADLRARLEEVDPVAAARIHANDRKRTIRAIEVFELSGRPISAMQQQWGLQAASRNDIFMLGLEYEPSSINRRINVRVKDMFEQGLVAEARRLHERGNLGRQAREALGYAQLFDAFEGRITEADAFEEIKIVTRRYARKQRTWLKRFHLHRPGLWLPADEKSAQELVNEALTKIGPWLADGPGGHKTSISAVPTGPAAS